MSASNEPVDMAYLQTLHDGNPPDFGALKRYLAPDAVYWWLVPSATPIKTADAICKGIDA